MMNLLRSLVWKLKGNKGEVSVEWALVAVVMCIAILATFLPNVQTAITAGIDRITAALTSGGAAPAS